MKVRELIEKLQTCDPELEVYSRDVDYGSVEVEDVDLMDSKEGWIVGLYILLS